MMRLSFFRSAVLAFFLSVISAGLFAVLGSIFTVWWSIRIVISLLVLVYVIYLLRMSDRRVGRMVSVMCVAVVIVLLLYLQLNLWLYLSVHAGMICLIRSLYFYNKLFVLLVDLAMTVLALAVSIWAVEQSSSVFLASWNFFLAQAAIVPMLSAIFKKAKIPRPASIYTQRNEVFQNAYRSAETALRSISSQR